MLDVGEHNPRNLEKNLPALVQKINDDECDVFTPDMKFPSGFATWFLNKINHAVNALSMR